MAGHDGATAAALARIAVACDGAILGLALAFCAVRSWSKYISSSSALDKIRDAPAVGISDLRSLLSASNSDQGESSSDSKLVVIRGEVQGKWTVGSRSQRDLVAQGSGERAVVIQRTQTCLYNELRGFFGWSFDLHALLAKTWKEQRTSSLRSVPFILVEGGQWPTSGFIHVKLEGSRHPLPLTTVYHQLHPIEASSFTFFQAIFGLGYPIALLDEEKILPVGKDITAVGICRLQDGLLEIKSSDELPYFLSDMTKDELEADLSVTSNILLWSGILLGALSAGVLGYAIVRNWWRWKDWRNRRRQIRESRESNTASAGDEESGDVPDGELCVVCLSRRRRSAFIPCGHLVCCPRCALTVERDSSPKCPVCRQNIRSSVRIYDS